MHWLGLLDGYKTIIAGLGLIGLGVYQCTEGQTTQGFSRLMEGLGLLGLRRAIATAR